MNFSYPQVFIFWQDLDIDELNDNSAPQEYQKKGSSLAFLVFLVF